MIATAPPATTRLLVSRRAGLCAVTAVAVLAAALRILPALARGGLTSGFWYDEAVYFFGSQQLWTGTFPYRDFQFVHPPGMLVALGPSAGLSYLIGDVAAMAVTKIVFMLLASITAGLVAYLLLDYGIPAALVGGGLYATWSGAIWSDTSILRQTLLNLGVVMALILLRRRRRRFGWAGIVLGLALTVKLWGLVAIVMKRPGFRSVVRRSRARSSVGECRTLRLRLGCDNRVPRGAVWCSTS